MTTSTLLPWVSPAVPQRVTYRRRGSRYEVHSVDGVTVVKSGTDFRNLSEIHLVWTPPVDGAGRGTTTVKVKRHDVTSDMPEDEETKEVVAAITAKIGTHLNKVVGQTCGALRWCHHLVSALQRYSHSNLLCVRYPTTVPLDGRGTVVRRRESNLGNFVADLMRRAVKADCALLNSGSIRSDTVRGGTQVAPSSFPVPNSAPRVL